MQNLMERITKGPWRNRCRNARRWLGAAICCAVQSWSVPASAVEPPPMLGREPFSFIYGGQRSESVLPQWPKDQQTKTYPDGREQTTTVWTEPQSGLRLTCEMKRFPDFSAVEWVLYFENTGVRDTAMVENVQALDVKLAGPGPFRLHRSKGTHATPSDFEPSVVSLEASKTERLGAGGGRSSNRDFPFFKIETGEASFIIAVGWSGQWQAAVEGPEGGRLHVTAGLEKTHFLLHPGEKVRSPRMLVSYCRGDTLECNAQFRRLIYRYFEAGRGGGEPMPVLFCNTCYTRGGGEWLNECNASNQISLIRAYAPLGLEAVITDAGWFEGGWPDGAGNWTPRREAYPDGMKPVAAAALEHQMIYGLWFEPERVVAGTALHKKYPEAILSNGVPNEQTLLADFGRPEIQNYFFDLVKGFMDLPGFRVYRQDFNMDPLSYWRQADPPNRQGIAEMKYIEGLYAYWDRIGATWPDSLREECASGGRRIDLETVRRMQMHQKSDYGFDNEVDQASLWSLSQYLPNNLISVPLTRMDDYSFHSTLASSLCVGWIADAPDFDAKRAGKLLERYRQVRHLVAGSWYPLLPYSRDPSDWMASQYHRPELNQGMVLAFRHGQSPYPTVELALHGLDAKAIYELTYDLAGKTEEVSGAQLMERLILTLPEKHSSELICYRKVR
jgi:alpha-galactosidase